MPASLHPRRSLSRPRHPFSGAAGLVLATCAFLGLPAAGQAQTKDWSQTGAAAAWSTGTWTPAGAPSGTDVARFRTAQQNCTAAGAGNVCAELRINADTPALWTGQVAIPSGAALTCHASAASALLWPTNGAESLTSAGTLELRGSASIAQSSKFTNTGVVRFTAFTANGTWTGPNVANWGTVQVDALAGRTLTLGSNITCGNLTIANGTLIVPAGTTLTVNGTLTVASPGELLVTGGTVVLNATPIIGTSNNTGLLTIQSGTVDLNAPLTLASKGTIMQTGGLFVCSADVDFTGLFGNYTASGGTFRLDGMGSGQILNVGGGSGPDYCYHFETAGSAPITVVAGGSSFRVDGSLSLSTQNLSLGGSTGPIQIQGPVLVGSNRTLDLGTVSNADLNGSLTLGANAVLNANQRSITLAGDLDASAGGTITNPGQLTFDRAAGTGLQTVSLGAGFGSLGAVVVNRAFGSAADVVRIAGTGTFTAASLTVTSGKLLLENTGPVHAADINGTLTLAANAVLDANGRSIALAGDLNASAGGTIANAGQLTFDRGGGGGVQTVSLTAGLGSLGSVVVQRASAADVVRVIGTGTFTAANLTLTSGTFLLENTGPANADINGSITLGANTVLNANTRSLALAGDLNASAGGTITNPGQLTFDRPGGTGVQTVSIVSGFGSLGAVVVHRPAGSAADFVRVIGTGTFNATSLTITSGTLLLENSASNFGTTSIAASQALVASAGPVTFNGGVTNNGTMRFNHGAVLNAGSATSFQNNGVLDRMTAGAATTLPLNFANGPSAVVLTAELVRAKTVSATLNPNLMSYTVTVTIDGYQGHGYKLQRTTDLSTGSFGDITLPQDGTGAATGEPLTLVDPNAPTGNGFYRVLVSP